MRCRIAGPDRHGSKPITSRTGNQRGMALVITLLVVAVITAMVVEFAYGVFVSTSSLHNWQTSQKLSVAARSATKLAGRLISSGLLEKTKAAYEMSQKIPYDDPEGTITVRIEDEGAKININTIVNQNGQINDYWVYALGKLLQGLELNPEIADRIVWWISPEARINFGLPNDAKGGPLDSIEELLLIPGIDRASYEKLLPYVTISGDGRININTAPVAVLSSLKNMTADYASRIIARRELTPYGNVAGLLQDLPMNVYGGEKDGLSLYATKDGGPYRITVVAESGGIKRVIESVVQNGIIKFWRES